MGQEVRQAELRKKTQQLLQGALQHVRAATLAAVLVPLGTVAVSPAVAQCSGSGCPPSVPSPCDFVTSGGFVCTDSNTMANFGAHGGCEHGDFWGHVNYVDHGIGYHVNSTEITGYLDPFPPSNTRDICGVATTSMGETVQFRVRLTDNGEHGRSDEFGIWLSNGYSVGPRQLGRRERDGGNVQLHDPNPSTEGPDLAPDEYAMCKRVGEPGSSWQPHLLGRGTRRGHSESRWAPCASEPFTGDRERRRHEESEDEGDVDEGLENRGSSERLPFAASPDRSRLRDLDRPASRPQ